MKHLLYIKVLFGYLLFGAISFLILCTFTQGRIDRYLTKQEAAAMKRESLLLANEITNISMGNIDFMESMQSELQSLGEYLEAEIWITDSKGNLLLDSANSSVYLYAMEQNYIAIPGFDITDFGNTNYMTGRFYDCFSSDTLSVISSINTSYTIWGYVLIHRPMSSVLSQGNGVMDITFFTLLIIYIIAFLFLALFTFTVYRPIRKITIAADSYAKGDFKNKIDVHMADEVGHLADMLNYMATELNAHEEGQRKFISNVSHDFRSPLTSIKGYVEAMLDGTIPMELQEKYLNIILFETERLNKLTESLLELNKFGRQGVMLEVSDFDINQIIRTTILTLEGVCLQKKITFDLLLTGKELYVTADMGKIQQVLYNLIDNAIKFSYNDSSIKIETHIRNEKVLVSVRDKGIGIPADSIKKIWDRFYKTDLSRGKDKRGTGLGLSIVKEIIQAHNEHINVISTEGVGTEFMFTLPLSKKEN